MKIFLKVCLSTSLLEQKNYLNFHGIDAIGDMLLGVDFLQSHSRHDQGGVTKAPFINLSFAGNFDLAKV